MALALFIFISSEILLAPQRLLCSWIELSSCFTLQVVMKGDRAAIHKIKKASKRKRGVGGKKSDTSEPRKVWEIDFKKLAHVESNTHSPLILPCFLLRSVHLKPDHWVNCWWCQTHSSDGLMVPPLFFSCSVTLTIRPGSDVGEHFLWCSWSPSKCFLKKTS